MTAVAKSQDNLEAQLRQQDQYVDARIRQHFAAIEALRNQLDLILARQIRLTYLSCAILMLMGYVLFMLWSRR